MTDLEEYRLDKVTDLYDIKVSKWSCWCPVFTIKGQNAEVGDFGDWDDIDRHCEDKPDHGCGNMTFTPRLPSQKILDKYNINVDEYAEIAHALEEGLSFGRCRLCD